MQQALAFLASCRALMMLLAAEKSAEADAGDDAQQPPTKRNGRQGTQPLCRPIIAVCNDLYAPALRPLRNVALIVQFKKTSPDKLANRLQLICRAENVKADKLVCVHHVYAYRDIVHLRHASTNTDNAS